MDCYLMPQIKVFASNSCLTLNQLGSKRKALVSYIICKKQPILGVEDMHTVLEEMSPLGSLGISSWGQTEATGSSQIVG